MSRKDKVPVDGGGSLSQNPFDALSSGGLPDGTGAFPRHSSPGKSTRPSGNRGRVEIRRETAGRGGRTVTTVSGFTGIGMPEKESLAKKMQRACGTGGTVKDGRIEIQGDHREKIAAILADAGFRPVFAGG